MTRGSAAVLEISRELALPLDAVTQVLAFLGRRGSGKTYGSTKTAECMLDAGAQVVVLDPVGAWWGLRLAANGVDAGIPIPIFGGLHGDIPLEPTSGALLADVVVDRGISAVLDVSQMIDTEQRRFAHAFARQLFQRKKAAPSAIFLVLEECQEFVPQIPQQGEQLMLHEFKRIAKLGRNFGIGLGLVSQRPQAVSKEVLNLTECMFAFQMTGPQERKAIAGYVSEKGGDLDIVAELPKYAIGECHVWSPQWLQISKTIRFAKKRTYDASSTPVVGAKPVATRALAPVDLEVLRTQMAETIERAKEDDPKELRATIKELQREVAYRKERIVEKPVIDQDAIARAVNVARADWRRELRKLVVGHLGTLLASASKQAQLAEQISAQITELDAFLNGESNSSVNPGGRSPSSNGGSQSSQVDPRSTRAAAAPTDMRASRETAGRDRHLASSNGDLPAAQQRVLDAIAFYESIGNATPAKRQVAGFVGVNPSASTWRGYLAPLRAGGYIEDLADDRLQLTAHGRRVARVSDVPSRAELLDQWAAKLSTASATILRMLAAAYPATLEARKIGERIGVDVSSSTWRGYMAPLRKLGLVEPAGRGEFRASQLLVPEGVR